MGHKGHVGVKYRLFRNTFASLSHRVLLCTMGYQPSQKPMELQYHVYKKFFRSGWVITDCKSAILYSMNAKHLYKHEVGGKRIVASMKHDTEEGYSINLEDEDKTFATYRCSGN